MASVGFFHPQGVQKGHAPRGVGPSYYTLRAAEAIVPQGTNWRTLLAPDAVPTNMQTV